MAVAQRNRGGKNSLFRSRSQQVVIQIVQGSQQSRMVDHLLTEPRVTHAEDTAPPRADIVWLDRQITVAHLIRFEFTFKVASQLRDLGAAEFCRQHETQMISFSLSHARCHTAVHSLEYCCTRLRRSHAIAGRGDDSVRAAGQTPAYA